MTPKQSYQFVVEALQELVESNKADVDKHSNYGPLKDWFEGRVNAYSLALDLVTNVLGEHYNDTDTD